MKRIWIFFTLIIVFYQYCDIYANGDSYNSPIEISLALNSITYSGDCSCPIELDLSVAHSINTYTGNFSNFYETFCDHDHFYDIWFTFVATRESMFGRVSGEDLNFSLFRGSCENLELIQCESNVSEIKFENLIVGDRYLFSLSVDGILDDFELEMIPGYYYPQNQITNFNIPELSDTTLTQRSFREDIDGSIWLFAKNVLGHDIFMKYSGDGWEQISGPCSACLEDVVIGRDGIIYLAAGNDGLYQYENGIWTQILTEEVIAVFIDAFDQLAVINAIGVGKVIDNQFVETNNDGYPGFQPKTEVITPENRIYLDKYEYCYEKGWTRIYVPPLPTLCCNFGYTSITKDTNYVLHYGTTTHTLSYSYSGVSAFDNGAYQSANLISNFTHFYTFDIDNDNDFWMITPETLRKDNGSYVREWPLTELFGPTTYIGSWGYSLFTDSKSNCWIINRFTGEIVVLHSEGTQLGVGFVADDFQPIEVDCTTFTYDIDGDGYRTPEDCDDYNNQINPGAIEVPNNDIDEDCNPLSTEGDIDGDGYGTAEDCDDEDPNINPDQTEEPYNGLDDDCDPLTLDDDLDQDGYLLADDCDDTNPDINPDAEEIVNNGVDENCDGMDLTSSTYEIGNTQIHLFPNPTSDKINLHFSRNILYRANLYDLTGALVLSKENTAQLEVSTLNQGAYILEIIDQKTGQFLIEKIIIDR